MGLLGSIWSILGTRGTRTYEEGYENGYRAGIERTLAALEGTAGANAYAGPVPPELASWMADVREGML